MVAFDEVNRERLFLVIGGTGAQGGSTARQLLKSGHRVRVLVRNPSKASELASLGAQVFHGDVDNPAEVKASLENVTDVFAIPLLHLSEPERETRSALTLIQAARHAGVRHFVQTSVVGAGNHKHNPRAGTGYWNEQYWESKWQIEQLVRNAGFAAYTILKPAMFMENFLAPMVDYMYPTLRQGTLVTAIAPDTRIQLIAVDDIGAFAVAAFEKPDIYADKTIELAADALTMEEIAHRLTAATGRAVQAISLSPQEALAQGRTLVREDEWLNEVGHHVSIQEAASYGIPLTSFQQWAAAHASFISIHMSV